MDEQDFRGINHALTKEKNMQGAPTLGQEERPFAASRDEAAKKYECCQTTRELTIKELCQYRAKRLYVAAEQWDSLSRALPEEMTSPSSQVLRQMIRTPLTIE